MVAEAVWFFVGALFGAAGVVVILFHVGRTPKGTQSVSEFLGFKKPEPEAPRDYAQTSIPRTRGPWRRQMRDLQAEHNTQQKERDALFAPQSQQENPNVRKAR